MRVTLTCEECGKIALMEGEMGVLEYALEARTEEHWVDAHPYPNISYDWSDK